MAPVLAAGAIAASGASRVVSRWPCAAGSASRILRRSARRHA